MDPVAVRAAVTQAILKAIEDAGDGDALEGALVGEQREGARLDAVLLTKDSALYLVVVQPARAVVQ